MHILCTYLKGARPAREQVEGYEAIRMVLLQCDYRSADIDWMYEFG